MKTKTTNPPTSHDFTSKQAQSELIVDSQEIIFPTAEEASKQELNARGKTILPTGSSRRLEDLIPRITVGIDLGDASNQICVMNQIGVITEEYKTHNTREAFNLLGKKYPQARFVMEVGSHSPWISEQLRAMHCEVFVGNARKLKAISTHERKCDELDARTLAKIGRMDTRLLYPIQHVSQDARKDRLVISSRENLVNTRKRLIQSVRGSVKSFGERIESTSADCFPKKARKSLAHEADILAAFEPTLKSIEQLNESIKVLDSKIDELSAEKYPATKILRQISGVGPITSIAFILAIEDPDRIVGTRDIAAYFGLVPRRDQSGNVDKQLGISKTGNPYIRKLLVQCAQHLMGEKGPDCDLKRFGLRRAGQGGDGTKKAAKGAKKKAIVAVARKLAVILLSLWRSESEYDPFRNSPEEAVAI